MGGTLAPSGKYFPSILHPYLSNLPTPVAPYSAVDDVDVEVSRSTGTVNVDALETISLIIKVRYPLNKCRIILNVTKIAQRINKRSVTFFIVHTF